MTRNILALALACALASTPVLARDGRRIDVEGFAPDVDTTGRILARRPPQPRATASSTCAICSKPTRSKKAEPRP